MAISSYPTPADAGVLCVILANTVTSIAIIKEIVQSILHAFGIRIASWEEISLDPLDSTQSRKCPSESYMDGPRTQIPAKPYDSIFKLDCLKQECSICLTEFDPTSEINHLPCGHIFHIVCLERWLMYWNSTCPLCRNHMTSQEVEQDTCPM